MFLLKKILAAFLLPPTSLLLLALFGLWMARHRPRTGHALIAIAAGSLLLLSTPWVASRLLSSLEDFPPITREDLGRAEAIVILGAGSYYDAPEYGGDTVNELALERLRYGARLARVNGLPVAVTGGAPWGSRPEGESMREALEIDFGVPVRWVETESRDTAENAAFLAPMLQDAGIRRIALVTHAWHMPRARELFERNGMKVLPAPTRFTTRSPGAYGPWLPSASGLRMSYFALHEWLGRWASGHFTPTASEPAASK